jgi:hypothetical protein
LIKQKLKMKTNKTFKKLSIYSILLLSIAACGKKDTPEPAPTPVAVVSISVEDLKKLSTSANVTIPDGKKIKGIVISDVSGKNIDGKTVVVQEATGKPGIVINFDAAQTFATGDEIEVNVSKQALAQVNSEIVLQNIPAANAKKTGTGTITARTATAADVNTNKASWNGTLVTLSAGSFSGGNGMYTGTLEYTDASGKIKSAILPGATFVNTYYPLNAKTITGIIRLNGNDVRIDLRKTADAESTNAYTLIEDFQSLTAGSGKGVLVDLPSSKWSFGNQSNNVVAGGLEADKGFLDAGRKYLYTPYPQLMTGGKTGGVTPEAASFASKLAGISTVSVTMAGSLVTSFPSELTSNPPQGSTWSSGWTFRSFDPTRDNIIVSLELLSDDGFSAAIVQRYTDLGKFHTATFTLPTTKAELQKIIDDSGEWWSDEAIDAYVAAPVKKFKLNFGGTGRHQSYGAGHGMTTPIIIQKIEFGYKTKPSWAN